MIPFSSSAAPFSPVLLSAGRAGELDAAAAAEWGLDPFALVEAAGRLCASVLLSSLEEWPPAGPRPRIAVLAGSGNNAADALVVLRSLIISLDLPAASAFVVLNRPASPLERSPRSSAICSLEKMGVRITAWDSLAGGPIADALAGMDLVIDGIAGTGLRGPLRGEAAEMAKALNRLVSERAGEEGADKLLVVSIDMPSGNFDEWEPSMPIVRADATLAIEPLKAALYKPAARPFAGTILPVSGIFPPALIRSFANSRADDRVDSTADGPVVGSPAFEYISWDRFSKKLPRISPAAYKHQRGVVEIHAGSAGTAGAARIAGRGAQAAGAGLVRLAVEKALYPILASSSGGVMAAAEDEPPPPLFQSDALLLGPGWTGGGDHGDIWEAALEREKGGAPLVLDAGAVSLIQDSRFHGNAVITPHAGEFAAWSGLSREAVLANPFPVLAGIASGQNLTILYKSHVMIIASPDGRIGIVDGMKPVLAAGGSGDLLAGFCAAIAARMKRLSAFDPYICAGLAAALLAETAASPEIRGRFTDPLELADAASRLAGAAWL